MLNYRRVVGQFVLLFSERFKHLFGIFREDLLPNASFFTGWLNRQSQPATTAKFTLDLCLPAQFNRWQWVFPPTKKGNSLISRMQESRVMDVICGTSKHAVRIAQELSKVPRVGQVLHVFFFLANGPTMTNTSKEVE